MNKFKTNNKPLSSNVADRQFRQNNIDAAFVHFLHFLVKNGPFRVDNLLIFLGKKERIRKKIRHSTFTTSATKFSELKNLNHLNIIDSNFGVVSFGFQFQFYIQHGDFGIFIGFLLHFESGGRRSSNWPTASTTILPKNSFCVATSLELRVVMAHLTNISRSKNFADNAHIDFIQQTFHNLNLHA
uniref:Uncharacterized protein n=1 Tax=Romanomermis culicivorax TaxID=13658 RepID=A0A915KJ38_ROMCU